MEEKQKTKPRLFKIERLPNGEKVLCVRGKRHGQKLEEKLTLEEVKQMFKEA